MLQCGMLRIGTVDYAIEMNTTKSHKGGSKDCPQTCGQLGSGEILGRRITQTCMEVLIRDEWIRLERTAEIVATSSGSVAMVEKRVVR
jgi:hypothetical protein